MPDTYEVANISEREMAEYFTRAFSSDVVKKMIENEDTLYHAEELFQKFGNILQAYASATGDLSDESVKLLAEDMQKHKSVLRQPYDNRKKLEAEQVYFGEYVMPKIIDFHRRKMGLNHPLSLNDSFKILAAVENSSKNNRFKTHSFNGALLPEIKKNGLDINKEMFIEEFAVLSSAKMMQPYQKGNLLFCELSKASFGYALRAPERLVMSLSRYDSRQQNDQSVNDFLTQEIKDTLSENQNLTENDKQKVFAAGKKIIDFYFGNNNKSAIAFIKDRISYEQVQPEKYEKMLGSQLSSALLTMKVNAFLDKNNDNLLKEEYKSAVDAFKQNKSIIPLSDFVDNFNRKYPESDVLRNITETFMTKNMSEYGLNNFVYNGNADGYAVAGGKLSRDQFALAEFDNPIDVYVAHNKKTKLLDNKLAILRNRLARKVDSALGTHIVEKTPLPQPLKKIERKISSLIFGDKTR